MSIIYRIKKLLTRRNQVPVYIKIPETSVLDGKTALITGGCGGIGNAIAKSFKDAGCDIIITGTNQERLNYTSQKLGVKSLLLDLNDTGSIQSVVKQAFQISDNGKIDILVNSAGVNIRKDFFDFTEPDFDSIMQVNVKGTFFVTQAVANEMRNRGIKGHILNIDSSSSLRPAWSPYRISKVLVSQITKGFADALIPYGIVVNALGPGPTATPMMGISTNESLTHESSPSGRYATPEEIAYLATYLVSDMANMIVGDTVYITGGSGTITYHR